MEDYSKFLEVALKAAKAGSEVALSYYNKVIAVDKKTHLGEFNPVTEADLETEKVISEIIRKEFPLHCIIGEECGSNNLVNEYSWYVDPIDGTSNYARGIPNWGVMIGLCHNDVPVIGVIYLPITGEVFHAIKGKGAFKNFDKLRVSKVTTLSEAFIESPGQLRGENRQRIINFFEVFIPVVRNYRHFGAGAVMYPLLASGKVDLEVSEHCNLHDIVPGVILAREAGGVALNFKGEEWTANTNNGIIIASTRELALEALQRLKHIK